MGQRGLTTTLITLALGGAGGAAAYLAGVPAAVLIGPALAVSLGGMAGLRLALPDRLRDVSFVVLGVGIGSGFDPDAGAAVLRWPLAFAALFVMLAVAMLAGRVLLERGFGFSPRSALLACAPGHLSFVLSIAVEDATRDGGAAEAGRIAVVQSTRLLALTLIVPFVALALGYRMSPMALPPSAPMAWTALAGLVLAGAVAGLGLKRLGAPAPLLLGAMSVSAGVHVSGLVPGSVPVVLMVPAFLILGTLIGTRFSGLDLTAVAGALGAGLAVTLVAVVLAAAVAVPVAWALQMALPHVLVAFAPGGLETMIALAATVGASPSFVAACHVMRLAFLSVLIPLMLPARKAPARVPE